VTAFITLMDHISERTITTTTDFNPSVPLPMVQDSGTKTALYVIRMEGYGQEGTM